MHGNKPPTVFISYSHDTLDHQARVFELAQALRRKGVNTELDQYHVRPEAGWPRWCEEQLRRGKSDFVLIICTEIYRQRVEEKTPADVGRGVFWEAGIIYNYICHEKANRRFIPILLPGAKEEDIPLLLRDHTHYRLEAFDLDDRGFEDLYRELTAQPAIVKAELGPIVSLAPRQPLNVAAPLPLGEVKTTFFSSDTLSRMFEKISRGRWENIRNLRCGFVPYRPFLVWDESKGLKKDCFGVKLLSELLPGVDTDYRRGRCSWNNVIDRLARGDFDIVVTPLFETFERTTTVQFTAPLFFTHVGLYAEKSMADKFALRDVKYAELKTKLDKFPPTKVVALEGEISEKHAVKLAKLLPNIEVESHHDQGLISCLELVCSDTDGFNRLMFCETFHACYSQAYAAGKIVNVLAPGELKYPVSFAIQHGDYLLKNLLNHRISKNIPLPKLRRMLNQALKTQKPRASENVDDHFDLPAGTRPAVQGRTGRRG